MITTILGRSSMISEGEPSKSRPNSGVVFPLSRSYGRSSPKSQFLLVPDSPPTMEVRLLFSTYSTGLSRGERLSPFALAADFSRPYGSDAIGVENVVCPPAPESMRYEVGFIRVRAYCNARSHRRSSRFRCPGIFRLDYLLYEGG
jgi:hypothetical protein